MNRNKLIWLFMVLGSSFGGFIPSLWGSGMFSMTGVFTTALGGIIGIYLGWRIGE